MCPMKVNKPLFFAALVLAPIQAFASPNAINAIEVQIGVGEKLGNYCSGGLEDRKLIEPVSYTHLTLPTNREV